MSHLKLVPDPEKTTTEKGKGNETLKLCDYTFTRTYGGTLELKMDWTGMSEEAIEEAFQEQLWEEHDIIVDEVDSETEYGSPYDACSKHKNERPYMAHCYGGECG